MATLESVLARTPLMPMVSALVCAIAAIAIVITLVRRNNRLDKLNERKADLVEVVVQKPDKPAEPDPSTDVQAKAAAEAPNDAPAEAAIAESTSTPLDVHSLVVDRPVGSGGQGAVWLARDTTNGRIVALKQQVKGRLAALKSVSRVQPENAQWLVERDALLECDHPFITRCFGTFQDDHSLYYALELASGGDLFSLLHSTPTEGRLPEAQCRFYTACVGAALEHIHSRGFLYCDIKLENVLITSDGYVKLCDFGLAKRRHLSARSCCFFGGREVRVVSKCGTDQYASPEVVSGKGRAMAADWWALGVLLHEMLTGHSPFEGKGMKAIFGAVQAYAAGGHASRAQLAAELVEDAMEGTSQAAADCVMGLLEPNEARRLGGADACADAARGFRASAAANALRHHPWMAALDHVALLNRELPAPWLPPAATATDSNGEAAPSVDEVDEQVARLFDAKRGVLRERPFEASQWEHLFAPFGVTVERLVQPPATHEVSPPRSPSTAAADAASEPSPASEPREGGRDSAIGELGVCS